MRGGLKSRWLGLALLTLIGMAGNSSSAEEPAKPGERVFDESALEFFEKQVRPILTSRCTECHGNGKGDPKGGLDLTSRAAVLRGGDTGPAIVPGKPKDSLLVSAIEYGDLYQMPPNTKLPAAEIATLSKWVEMGAPWPKEASSAGTVKPFDLTERTRDHWCWKPIVDPAVPAVRNGAWPSCAVDRFILAGLEARGLAPAPSAERRTLLRRLSFDLIGLPPTPEEVDAFLRDDTPQAVEHVVDRLLDSVHFGERWGRHWLDLVRYAETRGHEFEPIIPNAWQYRDYVIRALNADVPYDRFLKEHVAGDLLEPRLRQPVGNLPINESVLGTGFWFLGEEVHSPVDIRKDETDRMDNRLDVMSKTFLGLTVACARCHDHKFDAISQRDYYALTGYLISSSYRQVRVQTQENDRRIACELEAARAAARKDVAGILRRITPAVAELPPILEAAREAVGGGIAAGLVTRTTGRDSVYADFENPLSYGDWKAAGSAFGDRPPRRQDNEYNAPLEGFVGERLVNSHRNGPANDNNAGTRDAQVGRLTSPEFTINHGAIRFLIGGGAHPGRTCLNLEIDGKVVRTATGHNSGTLRQEHWNVADLRGRTARLVVLDDVRDGWGHILVDQIVFAEDSVAGPESQEFNETAMSTLRGLAASKKINVDLLARWCRELIAAKSDRQHRLHGFVAAQPAGATVLPPKESVVVDFGAPRPGDVIQDGESFGRRPVARGELVLVRRSGTRPDLGIATLGAWERDPFWTFLKLVDGTEDDHGTLGAWHRHGRAVRTPEFALKTGQLWYLVRGSVRAYACVNSHLVVAGPLHGSLVREYKHSDQDWHWVPHGLDLYRGNRLHVEFLPGDDEPCAIAMVVQSDSQPPLPATRRVDPGNLRSELALATAVFEGRAPESVATAVLANWLVTRRDLLLSEQDRQAITVRLQQLEADETRLASQVKWESQLAPAILDGNGIDELLLVRGNSKTPRDAVQRRFLEALGANVPQSTGSGRLELAQQMLDSPLAARVAVNRVWHHLFGRGLVPSVDNFGVLGQAPTHPELLDALAVQLRRDGWSIKRLIRSLVLTRTYQMSSRASTEAVAADPDNLTWHHMPIKRLEGEVIRDALLTVSGRLDRTPFGPSVPIHLTPFMEGRGRPGVSGPLDGNGRRSIYIAVRRNFLSPMMLAFDTPAPFSTVGRRTVSNVPAQALILMNDPLVLEQARRWAERSLAVPGRSDEARVTALYEAAFSRPPSPEELQDAIAFLESQSARLGIPDSQRRTALPAWTDLCHVLFNLKEFVFIE